MPENMLLDSTYFKFERLFKAIGDEYDFVADNGRYYLFRLFPEGDVYMTVVEYQMDRTYGNGWVVDSELAELYHELHRLFGTAEDALKFVYARLGGDVEDFDG